MMASKFDYSVKGDMVEGTNYEADNDEFCWLDGMKSELTPIDPYRLGLRNRPLRPGQSPFEFAQLVTKGTSGQEITPVWLITVFFLAEKPHHFYEGELRMNGSDDNDSPRNRNPKRRANGGDGNMDVDGDGGDGGDGGRTSKYAKKVPQYYYTRSATDRLITVATLLAACASVVFVVIKSQDDGFKFPINIQADPF